MTHPSSAPFTFHPHLLTDPFLHPYSEVTTKLLTILRRLFMPWPILLSFMYGTSKYQLFSNSWVWYMVTHQSYSLFFAGEKNVIVFIYELLWLRSLIMAKMLCYTSLMFTSTITRSSNLLKPHLKFPGQGRFAYYFKWCSC